MPTNFANAWHDYLRTRLASLRNPCRETALAQIAAAKAYRAAKLAADRPIYRGEYVTTTDRV